MPIQRPSINHRSAGDAGVYVSAMEIIGPIVEQTDWDELQGARPTSSQSAGRWMASNEGFPVAGVEVVRRPDDKHFTSWVGTNHGAHRQLIEAAADFLGCGLYANCISSMVTERAMLKQFGFEATLSNHPVCRCGRPRRVARSRQPPETTRPGAGRLERDSGSFRRRVSPKLPRTIPTPIWWLTMNERMLWSASSDSGATHRAPGLGWSPCFPRIGARRSAQHC